MFAQKPFLEQETRWQETEDRSPTDSEPKLPRQAKGAIVCSRILQRKLAGGKLHVSITSLRLHVKVRWHLCALYIFVHDARTWIFMCSRVIWSPLAFHFCSCSKRTALYATRIITWHDARCCLCIAVRSNTLHSIRPNGQHAYIHAYMRAWSSMHPCIHAHIHSIHYSIPTHYRHYVTLRYMSWNYVSSHCLHAWGLT